MDNELKKNTEGQSRTVETERIPVIEQRVIFDKRVIEGNTVTVTTRVEDEEIHVSEPVRREEITVERVPVGAVVDEVPDTREDGDLTVIPVVEERLRMVRELVLVEEIHLRRTSSTSTHEESVTVSKTRVDISDGSNS